MPIFKGFEKENDTVLAVIDYPEGKRQQLYMGPNGTLETRVTPFPHEERFDEATCKKFLHLDFDALKALPYKEEGHDLGEMITEQSRRLQASVPMPGPLNKPGGGGAP